MSKNHTHKRKPRPSTDWADFHDRQLLEWMKREQDTANPYGPPHSYNLAMYVKDPTAGAGLLFYLHTLGFKVKDFDQQPWHICEFVSIGNRYISLVGDKVSYGGIYELSNGEYLNETEIRDAIDKHIADCIEHFKELPEDERYDYDCDYLARPFINCGTNYRMFKVLCDWHEDDWKTKLIVNMRNPEKPFLEYPASNIDDVDYYLERNCRIATVDDIIEYFSGKGTWDHYGIWNRQQVGDKMRQIPFEATI